MKVKLVVFVGLLLFGSFNIAAQNGGKAEPNRINFARGKFAATLSGTLANNQEMDYIFAAKAGQNITLRVVSNTKGNLFAFSVDGANSIELETQYDTYSDYKFTAPETGDYLVTVIKKPTEKSPKAKFSLTLSIK